MATINCNQITQTINELLIAFQNCKKINNSDLTKLVELVAAVNSCANGGPNYDTEITEYYNPIEDELVSYPVDSFHSISVMVIEGNISQEIDVNIVTYPTGTVLNTEFTTLNQTTFEFTVKAGATVVVKYLVETV